MPPLPLSDDKIIISALVSTFSLAFTICIAFTNTLFSLIFLIKYEYNICFIECNITSHVFQLTWMAFFAFENSLVWKLYNFSVGEKHHLTKTYFGTRNCSDLFYSIKLAKFTL